MSQATVHAGAIIIGTIGVLLRGRSGAGKSTLADFLVESTRLRGHFACHVSDDRSCLVKSDGNILAHPPRALSGLLEVRGIGIQRPVTQQVAVIRLVLDLVEETKIERLPEKRELETVIQGIRVPSLCVPERSCDEAIRCVRWRLRELFPNSPDYV